MTARVVLLLACGMCQAVYGEDWQPLTGAATLQEFVAGATAEIELRPGVTATGKYNADGTAEIRAWDETFPRTWAVQGDDQVCYSSDVETNCFSFEQNRDQPGEFRSRNVETGEVTVFRIVDAETRRFGGAGRPDDEGGLGAPSAADIAAALSDPNTTLGTMNFLFDYVAYDGDIPGAGGAEAWRLSNTSLNRWAGDLTVAGTWQLAEKKFELSGVTGITFNGQNDDTDYDTGTEFHVEGSAFYQLSPVISAGLNGYYYKQVSSDTGDGATLGSFKGRKAALGPGLTANFQVGPAPVTLNLRYYNEFSVKKRLEGDAVWLTAALPLWVPDAP